MKKQLSALVILVMMFVLFLSGCQESSENKNNGLTNFSTYINMEKGFSIKYPSTWSKYENPDQMPDVDVLFVSPSNEPTKTGNLMISVIDNVSLTMDEFKEAHIENQNILHSNFGIEFERNTTLSDLPGYEIGFIFTKDIYTMRQLEVWTINKNTLYLLAHQADQAYYENFTADIEYMIQSFDILDL